MIDDFDKFAVYRVVSRLYFHLPFVFILYWSLNVTYLQAAIFMASYSFASTVSSSLTKLLTQFFSLRGIMIIGEVLKIIGLSLTILSTLPGQVNIQLIIIAQFIGGVGFTVSMSADGGLWTLLLADKSQELISTLQGKIQSFMFLATLGAGFIGGILYDHNAHFPFLGGIAASIVSIIILLTISNPGKIHQEKNTSQQQVNVKINPVDPLRERWILFYALTRAFALGPFLSLLPLYFYLQNVDPYLFGFVLGLFTLGGFFVAKFLSPILSSVSLRSGIAISLGGILTSFITFGLSEKLYRFGFDIFYLSLLAISLLGVASGSIRPIVMPRLDLSGLNNEERVAVFSRMEKITGYMTIFVMLYVGFLGQITTLFNVFLYLFLTLIIAAYTIFKQPEAGLTPHK